MKVLVINGPNLNMLGRREPQVYGKISYNRLVEKIHEWAGPLDVDVEVFQSNSEGEIINLIQDATEYGGIIINAGGYTHSSVAIRDALLSVGIPIIEVHISNIFSREGFRKRSFISDIAVGVITGFGIDGYRLSLLAITEHLKAKGHVTQPD